MRYGRKICKELFVILYVFIFLVSDPKLVRACSMIILPDTSKETITSDDVTFDFFDTQDPSEYHIVYEVNGGINSSNNQKTIQKEELPFTLDVPVKMGYNFAGWYADCSYSRKATKIDEDSPANMVLFAKWTKNIDNHYNVEMYSYQTGTIRDNSQKELKECSYTFLDDLSIPGMPSTREKDYKDNLISSSSQCMQGLCFTPDYILITAYSEDRKNLGSLMVFDRESGEYLATLGMKKESHLGGIAFDGENVWICHSNSNTLERISYEYITKIAQDAPEYCIDASALSDEYRLKNTPSCITCYGGRLWVATHTRFFDSEMYSYSYDKKEDKLTAVSNYNLPSKVQGVAFDDNGSIYLSTSYGRNNSSYLKVYSSLLSLDKKPNEPKVKVEMPPCSEEVAIADGTVFVLFESASAKYFEGTDGMGKSPAPIDKLLEVSVASIW